MTALDWTVLAGLIVWALVKWGVGSTDTSRCRWQPSLAVYVGLGLLLPERRADVDDLLDSLNSDRVETDDVTARRAAAVG